MSRKNFYLILITAILFLIFSISLAPKTEAANEPAIINGYAWSPNIGWIDMSGVECVIPVNTSGESCDIKGYAWSPNIGWIQFGNLSSFPSASGYTGVNARISFTSNDGSIDGWFRAWSLITSSSSENHDNEFSTNGNMAEGADGWASFRGGAQNLEHSVNCGPVVMNTEKDCSGYAWGSNVLGWIDFSKVKVKYPKPKLVLEALGGGQWGTQTPRTPAFSSNGTYMPQFRWTFNKSYLIPSGQKCYFHRSTNGQMAQKIPVDLPSPTSFNFTSPSGSVPAPFYNGTGVSGQSFFTSSDCGSYAYQLECATYGIGSTGEPATIFSNEIVFNICGNPSIDVVGGCGAVDFNGTTNIPANTPCSGIAGISAVPTTFPVSYSVAPGSYTLTCGAASKQVNVLSSTNPQCAGGQGGGQPKQPTWKEN